MSEAPAPDAFGEVLAANETYARDFDKGGLALPPTHGFVILACQDARLEEVSEAGRPIT